MLQLSWIFPASNLSVLFLWKVGTLVSQAPSSSHSIMRGECQVMDLGQMETPGQKQTGPLDYMSEGKNILSWLLQLSGPLYRDTYFKRKLYLSKGGGFKHSKTQNLWKKLLLLCLMLLFQISCSEKWVIPRAGIVKLLIGSDEIMALSRGK